MFNHKLNTFLTVVKLGSYTKAAKKLYISQPAVSQQLKSLEEELNIKLFTYKQRKLNLTNSGQQLLSFVESLNAQSNKFKKYLHRSPNNKKPLFIAATQSITNNIIPNLITFISRNRKDIEINCQIMNTEDCLYQLKEGKIDFALVEGNFNTSKFKVHTIFNEPFIAVASPKLGIVPNKRYNLTDLLKFPLIYSEKGSGSYDIMIKIFGTQNISINSFQKKIQINNIEVIKQLIKKGLGISFMYKETVQKELKNKKLIEINLYSINICHPIYLIYLNNNYFENEYLNIIQKWKYLLINKKANF